MKDTDVFDGKKLSDILKSIHDNSITKRVDIDGVIQKLVDMIKTSDDAVILMPLIREFYDVGIKNDDQVVKVATIVQRLISADSYQGGEGEGFLLSDAEKTRLMENALIDLNITVKDTNDSLDKMKTKLDGI